MALRIEHRTEDGVMVLSARASLASLATRVVGTGEELVVINQRTGGTLVKFTVPHSSPPASIQGNGHSPIRKSVEPSVTRSHRDSAGLTQELNRYGLDNTWESLMEEVERRRWYVVPASPSAQGGPFVGAFRHVVLGVGSTDSHVTVEGWGRTVVEALGWAVARALDVIDATQSP
jgi:hypothetical protein